MSHSRERRGAIPCWGDNEKRTTGPGEEVHAWWEEESKEERKKRRRKKKRKRKEYGRREEEEGEIGAESIALSSFAFPFADRESWIRAGTDDLD